MNNVNAAEPFHEFGADQLFFSVTDGKGVIQEANQVFIDLSRYDIDELMGAPHNVIRHPAMPGGTFHAMWATLKAGQPFGAYVRNRAKDGSRYDVYATVTPLPNGGFLSVRSRPMCVDVRDVVFEIYEATLQHEEELRENTSVRREIAASGAERLLTLVKEAGFASYSEFQNAILPMEVLTREAETPPIEMERTASGTLGDLQDNVHGVFRELDEWMRGLEPLERLSLMLRRARRRLGRDIEVTASIVGQLEQLDEGYEEVLAPLQQWAQMRNSANQHVEHLQRQLEDFDGQIEQSRFTIALARLHTTMVVQFIEELAAKDEINDAAERGIRLLADALDVDILTMWETAEKLTTLAETVNSDIQTLVEQLREPLELMVGWRESMADGEHSEELKELIQSVSGSTLGADAAIKELTSLAEQVAEVKTVSTDELMTYIEQVRDLASLEDEA
ncbi:PAS domain-containing protein [Corynebacterium sp.]|uniref:PAS domain-containing protein n=1 Tax=Corynebacterium sp. TaxID=1720 RepID=UPI0026DD59DC|nr:PAS domain-containing protein [Corynebacterium sp.]MDO5077000.1 PAS domain S-box protein [Corynebacterium sp.]